MYDFFSRRYNVQTYLYILFYPLALSFYYLLLLYTDAYHGEVVGPILCARVCAFVCVVGVGTGRDIFAL